jgi:hypothetical protein
MTSLPPNSPTDATPPSSLAPSTELYLWLVVPCISVIMLKVRPIKPAENESTALTTTLYTEEDHLELLPTKRKSISLADYQRIRTYKMSEGKAVNYKYLDVWRRATFRIKVRKVLSWLNDEIIKYGTSSDFVDQTGKFKLNVDEILWKKQNKQENFRLITDTTSEVLPWNLIHPDSKFIKTWSIVLSLILLYTATIMPVRVAFYDVIFFDAWTIVDLMMDSMFAFDILVNCFVAYERRDGTLEKSPTKVFTRYARSWLAFDIVACLPFSFIEFGNDASETSSSSVGRYNNLIRLLRVPRLYKLLRILRIAKAFKNYRDKTFFTQIQDYLSLNSSKL